jgi:hypothetical protein
MKNEKTAQLSYSSESKSIELVVPHGTKMADIVIIITGLVDGGVIGRLPRGCNTCTSGDHFLVRESLADTITVDLDNVRS